MSKITYDDKIDLHVDSSIANINKVSASDMNEIKTAVNDNADDIGDISTLTTTDKTSVVNAVNELETNKLEASAVVNEPSTETDEVYSSEYLNDKLVSVGTTAPTDGKRVWFPKGKNLFDGQLELGSYGGSGETTSTTNTYRNINAIFVSPNTTYTFSINGTTQKYVVLFYDVNKNYISQNSSLTTGTFTTPNNTYFVNFRSFVADFVNDFANLKVQLEQGSIATAYEQYVTPSIKVDGNEIYNLKLQTPQKITLSFNTTYVYETDLDYTCFRLGKLVFLFINTLAFRVGTTADFPNYSNIVSGLPRPAQTKIFYLQSSGNFNRFRANVTTAGNVQRHWSSDPSYGDSSNKQYSGFIVYETID